MFGAYVSLLLAVVVAGFLAAAVGTWAAILWSVATLAVLALYGRQRLQRRSGSADE
jgi:hypothetical protein